MVGMEPSNGWKDWVGVGIGLLLVAIGIIGIIFCPNEVGVRFSEAAFIAGVLTVAVDPFLKRRLLKEASKDIFHHLLGFDLPLEIRETLREFLEKNKYYQRNALIEARAETRDNDTVEIHWSLNSEIIAVAPSKYRQNISFEEAEHGRIEQASITFANHPEWNYSEPSPALTPIRAEPMVLEWYGNEINLKKGDTLRVSATFVTRGPKTGFSVLNFGAPSIHPRVRVESSNDLEISASLSDQRNGNEYIYQKTFVRGDHIQVRWKPKLLRSSV
jgi:hypothetical protein